MSDERPANAEEKSAPADAEAARPDPPPVPTLVPADSSNGAADEIVLATFAPHPSAPPLDNPYARVMAQVTRDRGTSEFLVGISSELAPPLPPPKPRIWSALAVGLLTMPLAGLISTILLFAAMYSEYGSIPRKREALQTMVEQFATTKLGVILMIAPGQFVFLTVALLAAMVSPIDWRTRLNLGRGKFPTWMWTWPVLAIGTPMVGFLSAIVVSQVTDARSENLQMLQKLFQEQQGPFVLALYLLIGVLPGVAEELLFRGYVQTRLAQRLPAWAAIGITAAMFAVAHFDPVHVVAVFPLGVWLGFLAWRTGSIWPAMLAHAANNCVAVMMTRWGEVNPHDNADLARRGMVVLGCGWALMIAIGLLAMMRIPKSAANHV